MNVYIFIYFTLWTRIIFLYEIRTFRNTGITGSDDVLHIQLIQSTCTMTPLTCTAIEYAGKYLCKYGISPSKVCIRGQASLRAPPTCSNYYDCTSNMKSDATVLKNLVK